MPDEELPPPTAEVGVPSAPAPAAAPADSPEVPTGFALVALVFMVIGIGSVVRSFRKGTKYLKTWAESRSRADARADADARAAATLGGVHFHGDPDGALRPAGVHRASTDEFDDYRGLASTATGEFDYLGAGVYDFDRSTDHATDNGTSGTSGGVPRSRGRST